VKPSKISLVIAARPSFGHRTGTVAMSPCAIIPPMWSSGDNDDDNDGADDYVGYIGLFETSVSLNPSVNHMFSYSMAIIEGSTVCIHTFARKCTGLRDMCGEDAGELSLFRVVIQPGDL
jgi:hypothetical protein